jgi:hypothetical protein
MSGNILTEHLGHVPVCDKVCYYSCYIHPKLHRGVLISNPNMMFISTYGSDTPLMACDAFAWLLAGYVTGCVSTPSPDEMRARNVKEGLEYLDVPFFRYIMDDNYYQAVNSIENMFPDDPAKPTPLWDQIELQEFPQSIKVLARTMTEANYPFSFGTFEQLNENGERNMELSYLSYYHRSNLNPVGHEKDWKTFRDYDNPEKFTSLFTYTKAVKIDKPWMEIDNM